MTKPRTLAQRAREAERRRRRYVRGKARHSHPVFTQDDLAALRDAIRKEPDIPDGPDRSTFRTDADREAAIQAHIRRIARITRRRR